MTDRTPSDAELARRISMLAAEHSSLQAQRVSTQAEVLVRQGLYLTLASAVLVSLGLVAQAIGFSRDFFVVAVYALAVVALLGVFMLVRQANADAEDIMYVLAMNRIRGAYVALDPDVEPELLGSPNDDFAGAMRTYYFFADRWSTLVASAAMFLTIVNAGIIGLMAGAISALSGGPLTVSVIVGVAAAVLSVLAVMAWIGLGYLHTRRAHVPRYPTPRSGG